MDTLTNWIVLIIGILLLLPLIGVDALGSVTEGIGAWLIMLGILVIAIKGLIAK